MIIASSALWFVVQVEGGSTSFEAAISSSCLPSIGDIIVYIVERFGFTPLRSFGLLHIIVCLIVLVPLSYCTLRDVFLSSHVSLDVLISPDCKYLTPIQCLKQTAIGRVRCAARSVHLHLQRIDIIPGHEHSSESTSEGSTAT